MHNTVGAPTVEGDRPSVGVPSPIGIYEHSSAVDSHAEDLAETERKPGCGPTAIIVIADFRVGFVPETRVVGKTKCNVDLSSGQAKDRRGKLKVAAAGPAVRSNAGWITDNVCRITC